MLQSERQRKQSLPKTDNSKCRENEKGFPQRKKKTLNPLSVAVICKAIGVFYC